MKTHALRHIVGNWSTGAVFTAQTGGAAGRFGNQGVGLVRAPGSIGFNASLIRVFPLGEGTLLHFHGEMQNLPNHPNFGLPGQQFEGPGFGIINVARPARQVQIGARITF